MMNLFSQNSANVLPNASFELVNPANWDRKIWDGDIEFTISPESHSGNHSNNVILGKRSKCCLVYGGKRFS